MEQYVGMNESLEEESICVIDQSRKIVIEVKVASRSDSISAFLARNTKGP